MTKLFLIAASALLSVATSPVVARDASSNTAPAEQSGAARTAPPAQRYCILSTTTGSRIEHKTCHTREDWLKEGFDPLAKDQ